MSCKIKTCLSLKDGKNGKVCCQKYSHTDNPHTHDCQVIVKYYSEEYKLQNDALDYYEVLIVTQNICDFMTPVGPIHIHTVGLPNSNSNSTFIALNLCQSDRL